MFCSDGARVSSSAMVEDLERMEVVERRGEAVVVVVLEAEAEGVVQPQEEERMKRPAQWQMVGQR